MEFREILKLKREKYLKFKQTMIDNGNNLTFLIEISLFLTNFCLNFAIFFEIVFKSMTINISTKEK